MVKAGLAEPLSDLTVSDMVICRCIDEGQQMEFRDWIGCDVDALGFQGKWLSHNRGTELVGVHEPSVGRHVTLCIVTIIGLPH